MQVVDNLRVNALGPSLTFFVNGKQVSQVEDASYTDGQIALYVETFDSPEVQAHYHSLVVRKPEGTAPAQPTAQPAACQVLVPLLNLRRGPGMSFAPTVGLFAGTQLAPLARSADGQWIRVQVQDSGQEGWVSALGGYVSCSMPITGLSVSQ